MPRRESRPLSSGETALAHSVFGGALDPEMLRSLAAAAEATIPAFGAHGASPLVVTAPDLRRYVRAILERKLPQVPVVSFREIDASAPLRVIDRLAA